MVAMEEQDLAEKRSFIELARRKQIIEQTIDTLADLGYAQTSLAQIAKRAGISKGVISYHFAGKNELIRETFFAVYIAGAEFMGPQIERATTATGRLRAYIESNLGFMHAHPRHIRAIAEIVAGWRDERGKFPLTAQDEEPIVDILMAMLRDGQERGELRAFDPRVVARSLRGAIDAAAGELVVRPDTDLVAYGRELADLFERATSATPR
jgi:AcrR family transcriptional regulator